MRYRLLTTVAAVAFTLTAAAQPPRNVLTLDAGAKGIPVQKTMYGLFFEDINFAADGGLYAEMVKNRSFDFPQPLMGWRTFGNVEVRTDGPFERNPNYVRLGWPGHPVRFTGIENEGFFGMSFVEGERYRFSVWARTAGSEPTEAISIHICDNDTMDEDQMSLHEVLTFDSPEWKRYEVEFTSPVTNPKATLRIFLQEPTPDRAVDLEHISLFPAETFNGDDNGLRKDIAEALAELQPGVFRFPGGCIVEGTDLDNRYQWKNSVGAVENRPLNINRWNYTFPYRLFPDYYQSYGLGFYEYFRFAEEIGAEPLPVISCGMACQFQNDPEWHPHAEVEDLGEYIQDALDLIEFANGDPSTEWGRVRAEMGHPAPFGLKFLAVGNEQWGEEFVERLEPFVKAIRERYPKIQIIGSSGPYLGGEWFEHLWPEMRRLGADLVDEHFYAWEGFFENNADRYDNYPRKGAKVFAGEYACHGSDGKKFNHFNAALMEAAFMTGLERNADVVYMATYAPLLAHVEGWQWRPDLVWFDNSKVVRTCSYYVQQLYAANKGTHVLPLTMNGKAVAGKEGQNRLYATAVKDVDKGEYIVKVANLSEYSQPLTVELKNLPRKQSIADIECTWLHSDNPMDENTVENPDAVVPRTRTVSKEKPEWGEPEFADNTLKTRLPARSFVVYRFKY